MVVSKQVVYLDGLCWTRCLWTLYWVTRH